LVNWGLLAIAQTALHETVYSRASLAMPVHNSEIADIFDRMAILLEIQGANPFRVRAYRNAARTLGDLPRNVVDLLAEGQDLSDLPGIGKDLAGKIAEIAQTGHLTALTDLEEKLPASLVDLTGLPGLGAKRVRALYEELGIASLDDLERAATKHRVQALPGFGEKTELRILRALSTHVVSEQRHKLVDVERIARSYVGYLEAVPGVKEVVVAGSYRRRQETIGDLDILVTCKRGSPVVERFVAYDEVAEVVSQGHTRSTVSLRSGVQVDLRVVADVSYGAALYYFTGSKAHNIAVRKIAVTKKLKINEYGVFKGKRRVAGRTEDEVFKSVGLRYIEPELRENRGEIEAARKNQLPALIRLADIQGDLHVHTDATDGSDSLRRIIESAQELGYRYIAVTDHSKRMRITHGMDERRLRRQLAQIDRLNQQLRGIVVLKGVEVDILENGKLDLSDNILKELDLTVCAAHSGFNLDRMRQTERVIRAMDNPYFNILAHPTGRLINQRDAYELDMERVMSAALERGCYLELNAHPDRLDLNDVNCRLAREMGLKVAISTDAHSTTGLQYMRFGIDQARRGWLGPEDIINSRSSRHLKRLLTRP
jgi:DNA polymerase (family 10)